jgi:hypothetical protein
VRDISFFVYLRETIGAVRQKKLAISHSNRLSLGVTETIVIAILFLMSLSFSLSSSVNMLIMQHKYYFAFCVKLDIALNEKSGTELNFFFSTLST